MWLRLLAFCLMAAVFGGWRASGQSAPVILEQPTNQIVAPRYNVTFIVGVEGQPGQSIPQVTSGTLQVWLEASAGVVTNASGLVSNWMDQSGNGNDASQATSAEQPVLEYPKAIGGLPAIRFNGVQVTGHGDYLYGANNIGIPDAYTSFLVYEMDNGTPSEQMATFVGVPGNFGQSRGYWITNGMMAFSSWGYNYYTGYAIPTNTYRIWTDRYSIDSGLAELWDDTATWSTGFDLGTAGESAPAAGYYVGGLNPAVEYVGSGRNFGGDIAELIYYQGELTDSDRVAVLDYLEEKYFQINPPDSYQWQFDGTNIVGATNYFLTLTNVLFSAAGSYSVVVSNSAGVAQSSDAVLLVGLAPSIYGQPQSQAVGSGGNASFSVAATGTTLAYQWFLNNSVLSGQTNATLALTNVTTNEEGQ